MQSGNRPFIDPAVMQQISEYCHKTNASPNQAINDALRFWLDTIASGKLELLGLEPLSPRFDGTAGYGRLKLNPSMFNLEKTG